MKPHIIPRDHSIVTAYAEPASGPGWANRPLWVITRDGNQQLHQQCIQPEEQTPEMGALYNVSAVVHQTMTAIVESATSRRRTRRQGAGS